MLYYPESKYDVVISRLPWQQKILYQSKRMFLEGQKRERPFLQILKRQSTKLSNVCVNEIKLNFQIKFKSSSIKIPQLNKTQQGLLLSKTSNTILFNQFKKSMVEACKIQDQAALLNEDKLDTPDQAKTFQNYQNEGKSNIQQMQSKAQNNKRISQKYLQKAADIQDPNKKLSQSTVANPVIVNSVNLSFQNSKEKVKQSTQKKIIKKTKKNTENQNNQSKKKIEEIKKNEKKVEVNKVNKATKKQKENKKETKLDKFLQNFKISDFFECKSQRKLKYTIKSYFQNIVTIEIELTNQPIKILGFYKVRVKSFKIMKKFKLINDGMIQFYPIREKLNDKDLEKDLKLTQEQKQQFYEIDSQDHIALKVQSKGVNAFATIVLQLQENIKEQNIIILD